ncbi:MAG: aspartate kinase, partial [Mariprofundaceae bacterium]|nr:aspartate kinase [Mariprofundaceae bacterium]
MRVVHKYGGTSVGSLDRIRATAQIIQKDLLRGYEIAVVVSAMSGETNRLLSLARDMDEVPPSRELDALVSTGEQVSAALLAFELHRLGIMAYSYN